MKIYDIFHKFRTKNFGARQNSFTGALGEYSESKFWAKIRKLIYTSQQAQLFPISSKTKEFSFHGLINVMKR